MSSVLKIILFFIFINNTISLFYYSIAFASKIPSEYDKNFEILKKDTNQIGLKLIKAEIIHDNGLLSKDSIFLANKIAEKNSKIIAKNTNNELIAELTFKTPNSPMNIVVVMPLPNDNSKKDIIHFFMSGMLSNNDFLKKTTVYKNKMCARFFPIGGIDNISGISMFAISDDLLVKSGLTFTKKDDIYKYKIYDYFLPLMMSIMKSFFPSTEDVAINAMSLGFIKMWLAFSRFFTITNDYAIKNAITLLTKIKLIINWSGVVDPDIKYVTWMLKIPYPIWEIFYVDVKSVDEINTFKQNVNFFLSDKKNLEYVLSLNKKEAIDKMQDLNISLYDIAKISLTPPMIHSYNINDFVVDADNTINLIYAKNGPIDILYSDMPDIIKARYMYLIQKYSFISLKADYYHNKIYGENFFNDAADNFNHSPDLNSIMHMFNIPYNNIVIVN
jgi:hypothetical protein